MNCHPKNWRIFPRFESDLSATSRSCDSDDLVLSFGTSRLTCIIFCSQHNVVGKPWNIIVLGNRTPRPRHLQGAIIKYINSPTTQYVIATTEGYLYTF
jgi:hypothetical protein